MAVRGSDALRVATGAPSRGLGNPVSTLSG
eukprot:COSAG06_NODE_62260_length_265_cov_0.939759_1_plen_29_part_01